MSIDQKIWKNCSNTVDINMKKSDLGFEKKNKIKKDKPNIHCLNCRKFGHKSSDYRERPKGPSKPSKTNKKGPKKIWIYLTARRKLQSWYLDSGCSHHMMGEKKEDELHSEDNIVGEGRIGKHHFPSIKNVLFIEGLKHNLLSISQLRDNGYDVSFNKGKCIVKDCNGSIIFSAKRQNNMYMIDRHTLTCLVL
ncbi:hypothetical protein CR513_53554, partial [Mucuna pruriens]